MTSRRKIRLVRAPDLADDVTKDTNMAPANINRSFFGPRGVQTCLFVALGLLLGFLYLFNFTTFF